MRLTAALRGFHSGMCAGGAHPRQLDRRNLALQNTQNTQIYVLNYYKVKSESMRCNNKVCGQACQDGVQRTPVTCFPIRPEGCPELRDAAAVATGDPAIAQPAPAPTFSAS